MKLDRAGVLLEFPIFEHSCARWGAKYNYRSIKAYIAPNYLIMNEENESTRYLLRAVLQKNFMQTVYILAKQFTLNAALPKMNENFTEGCELLMKRANEEENEEFFEMNYPECLFLLDMMSRIEAVFKITLPTFEKKLEDMSEDERENYEMSTDLIEMMTQVKDEILEAFPSMHQIFIDAEILRKKQADERKTMNLDNKTVLNGILMADPFQGNYFLLLFSFFEAFIILGESSFSERVREADFYCIKDINTVRERMKKAIADSLKKPNYYLNFTTEDLFVLFMVNNIYQKIFASDASDAADYYMENTKIPGVTATAKEIRSLTLQLSAKLELLLLKIGEGNLDFDELIEPVVEFGV